MNVMQMIRLLEAKSCVYHNLLPIVILQDWMDVLSGGEKQRIAVIIFFCLPVFLYTRLQTGRIMVWWCPSVRPGLRPSVRHSFPHFSPTCFDILIWNFVHHFIFMRVRSSSNAINFRHFLQVLCSFLTSNSYKYAVFRTFLLHALTYWVQILYMTLF